MSFSDLTTQCCQCFALYHPACLKAVEKEATKDQILCCAGCKSLDILPEGVQVKSLVATSLATLSQRMSPAEERLQAEDILQGQLKLLADLEGRSAWVAAAMRELEAPPGKVASPPRKRRKRLAYLAP